MESLISKQRFQEITNKFESLSPIIVVGDLGLDKYTYGEVRRISPEAPVPILEVSKEWLKLGLAANISHNLKTIGVESTLCGVVGNDKNASTFEHLLEECGLKTWGLVRSSDRPTIFKERVTTDTQQICRIDYESTDSISSETSGNVLRRVEDFAKEHGALIIEDYAKGSLTEDLVQGLIKSYTGRGQLVCVDPGRMTPPMWYKGATLLKPNQKEAIAMITSMGYREESVETIAKLLIDKLSLEKVVITLGGEGMGMIDTKGDGKFHHIPTVANEVYDVSGAGDTAISLLTASLMSGATLPEAAWIGNCGSGVVVAKKGTATVDISELSAFYEQLSNKLIQ
ncbi:MAG: bifunctional hydroxymethylpyrimidine kinase/phosphomethylpyrimidine kinase [Bacteriovoracaceae bacterium]|nr:bifunctional hydroxymethylpyrimidine kinase/phosphomethylpyrimidine kinase [Bacteriovoracaceae bacterium]